MFCAQCGKENREEARFCSGCGVDLRSDLADAPSAGVGLRETSNAPSASAPLVQASPLPAQASPSYVATPVAQPNVHTPAAGAPTYQPPNYQGSCPVTNVNVQVPSVQKNSIGTAGFVIALVTIFLSWIPVLGWILWLLGALFSLIGLTKMPKGLAIAGTIISFIDLIILVMLFGGLATLGMFI